MQFSIQAKKRKGGDAEATRSEGMIPAVVYGPEIKPVSIAVKYRDFEKLYDQAGESSLINCAVDGEKEPFTVLIQEVQFEPLKGKMIHADFRQIKMSEEMQVAIQLRFVNEAPAVKKLGGTLIKAAGQVNVKCLPRDLIGHLDVDLAALKTFEDAIRVKDLNLPSVIKPVDALEMVVAKVTPPLTEEQLKALEAEGEKGVEAVEIEKKKEEKEEGEEAAAEAGGEPEKDKKTAKKEDGGKKE